MSGWADTHVGVAVSGGADSVALVRALVELKRQGGGRGRLTVLHLDHGVRTDSAEDAAWVRSLADGLSVECVMDQAKGMASASEESLRDARRAFYRTAAQSLGARYLATGHTADDQAETVLFRALRGSGVRGLAGIRPFAPLTPSCTLARPLLGVKRVELVAYLELIGQAFREDDSNADESYTRNWLRHRVLPLIRERLPGVDGRLVGLAEQAAEAEGLIALAATELLAAAQIGSFADGGSASGEIRLDQSKLVGEPAPLVREALRLAWRRAGWPEQAMTAAWWHRLAEAAQSGDLVQPECLPGGVTLSATASTLVLAIDR